MSPAARAAVGILSVVLFVLGTVVVLRPLRTTELSNEWLTPLPHFGSRRVVIATPANGVAKNAALRVGDTLDLGELSLDDLGIVRWGLAPHIVRVPAERKGESFSAELRFLGPVAPLPVWARVLTIATSALCLALALLIVRGVATNRLDVRLLLGFVLGQLAVNVYYQQFATNGLWAIAGYFLIKAGVTLFWYFALRFLIAVPHRKSPHGPWLERTVLPLTALFTVTSVWQYAAVVWPASDFSLGGISFTLRAFWLSAALLEIAMFAAIVDGLLYSGRKERVQMQWIASTVFLALTVEMVRNFNYIVLGSSPQWLETFAFPVESIMVLGAAYAVLRHRLVDLEFVVSRAAVFTVVSATVVAIFVVAEWLAATVGDKIFGTVNPRPAFERFSGLIAALVAGLLARPVHRFVDRSLDRFFFARQHRDDEALRRFAREAEVATDSGELLAAAFEVARKHVEGSFVAFFVRDGSAYGCVYSTRTSVHPSVAENDPVALRMRRFGEPFELDDGDHEFHHAVFFPMTVLGRLIAFIVCGPKLDRTHYGEREIETLAQFAQRVGTAYAWLSETSAGQRVEASQAATLNSVRNIVST